MPRRRLPSLVALAACVMMSSLPEAFAQDSAAPAESLFEEGRRLLAENRFTEACAKLTESERLDPAVGTLLNLGDCYEKMGKIATAWATFKQATAMAARAKQASREKTASTRAAALEPKIPRLSITVPHPVPGLEVRRDGTLVGAAEWSASAPSALAIDPGEHDVTVSAPGKKGWSTKVTLAPDGKTTAVAVPMLEVDELAERAPLQPAVLANTNLEAVTAHDRNVQRGLAIAVGAVGAAAVVVAIPLGARALSLNKDAQGECPTNTTCTSNGESDSQSATALGTGSTILLSAGAAFAVGATVLYLTAPRPKDAKASVRIVPMMGPGALGLSGMF